MTVVQWLCGTPRGGHGSELYSDHLDALYVVQISSCTYLTQDVYAETWRQPRVAMCLAPHAHPSNQKGKDTSAQILGIEWK